MLGCIIAYTSAVLGCPTPSTVSHFNVSSLPNPFVFDDGAPVLTKTDWTCRRAQIAALVQGYEAGQLPGKPQKLSVNFTQVNTTATLAITATNAGKSITFSPTIKYPSGSAPAGGWPLVIGYSGGSIPIPSGVSEGGTISWTPSLT